MRIGSLIDEVLLVRKVLEHLGRWSDKYSGRPPPTNDRICRKMDGIKLGRLISVFSYVRKFDTKFVKR